MYRHNKDQIEVFLVHPGGPFWAKKDAAAWSVPKGEYLPEEDPLTVAQREFEEETGLQINGEFLPLGETRQPGGKLVSVWAVEGDCNPSALKSNNFPMEWPPRSGKMVQFPEIDRWEWFPLDEAKKRILKSQTTFLERLAEMLK